MIIFSLICIKLQFTSTKKEKYCNKRKITGARMPKTTNEKDERSLYLQKG